jgi:peptide-methionine (S)-S-oxide reductase
VEPGSPHGGGAAARQAKAKAQARPQSAIGGRCTGRTGHAEAVQVEYDPARVSYPDLLRVFFENHDPTTLNRQGPDVGSQYRSAIFFHTPEQQAAAAAAKQQLERSGAHRRPIVTEIAPAAAFYRAEDYHQQYLEKRGQATCRIS